MKSAEEIEDEIAGLIGDLASGYGIERAEEFIATVVLQCAAARSEMNVVRIPPRLRVVHSEERPHG